MNNNPRPSCEIHARYSRGCSECHGAEIAAVASALPSTWYAGLPVEFRVQRLTEQWQKLHERDKQIAGALAELRAELERKLEVCEEDRSKWANGVRTGVNASLYSLDKTIAKLGLNEPE